MNLRILYVLVGAVLLAPGAAAADEPSCVLRRRTPTTPSKPRRVTSANKRVQEKLRALGFYTGPVNGDIGPYHRAALAQFQLSVPIPASGQLDEQTVAALGSRETQRRRGAYRRARRHACAVRRPTRR